MTTKLIDLDGVHIEYDDHGSADAPALVFVNSLGTTLEMWDPQLDALSRYFRVLRYNVDGHGSSGSNRTQLTPDDLASDLISLLDYLGIAKAALCGLSLGGLIAAVVAARSPERVSHLVVAASSATFPDRTMWLERAARVRSEGLGFYRDSLGSRWFTSDVESHAPHALPCAQAMMDKVQPEGYARCCELLSEADISDLLAQIEAKTLVVGGALDPVCPPSAIEFLRSHIRDASSVIIPQASHLLNLEQPALFSELILDHLRGLPLQRGLEVRREVLGAAHVERSMNSTTPFTMGFQDFISRYAWGEIWTRPHLDRRSRSIVTITALIGGGNLEELALHIPGGLRNGLSIREIEEIVLQCAVYLGVPRANSTMAKVREILDHLPPDLTETN